MKSAESRLNDPDRAKRNERLVQLRLRNPEGVKLELGAGPIRRKGWTSIDIGYQADIILDIATEPLPFPDNSVDYIYSSHTLEHFTYPRPLMDILAEGLRCLKPGGVFDVCVPNARPYLEAYANKKPFPYPLELLLKNEALNHSNGRMDIANYIAYMAGIHRYMFDEENLVNILKRAGFCQVGLRDYHPAIDLEMRRFESIYALGRKPLPEDAPQAFSPVDLFNS